MKSRYLHFFLTGSILAASGAVHASFTNTFHNTSNVTIPLLGEASPFPSVITVSNLAGTIEKVTVDIRGINHDNILGVGAMVRNPSGDEVLLFSYCGEENNNLSGLYLTIDQDAASNLPSSGSLASGTYKPSNYYDDEGDLIPNWVFFGPTVNDYSNYNEDLSIFKGAQANGEWKLFVYDLIDGSDGAITNGWSITFITSASNEPPVFAAITNQGVTESGTLSFTVSASDPVDNDAITLSVEDIPSGASFADNGNGTGSFIWTNAGPVGVYTTKFVAADKDGSVTQSVMITVQAASDGDSIDDIWEQQYFGNLTTANNTTDFDGDRFIDLHEFLAGTVPTNAASFLQATALSAQGANMIIKWPGVTGKVYGVGMRTNLLSGGFSTIASNIAGVSPTTALTASPPASVSSIFFRIELQQPEIP